MFGAFGEYVERFFGIDFSGDTRMWSAGCKTSNVWIAEFIRCPNGLALQTLQQVQKLPGNEHPFSRLARLLAYKHFVAAGIDAPFSIPQAYLPSTGHLDFLARMAAMEKNGRPFPHSRVFLAHFPVHSLLVKKPLRATEELWKSRGVNVRSTLWTGARSGAPMAAACLTLLHQSSCPVWPWDSSTPGLLVEAFPAAQLNFWHLPYQKYAGNDDVTESARRHILGGLRRRLQINVGGYETTLLKSADALDAVICGLAAVAVVDDALAIPPDPVVLQSEGWIALHRGH